MAESGGQERTEEATPKRKQDARKKGTVARSTDLTGALVLLAIGMVMPTVATMFASGLLPSFSLMGKNMPSDLDPHSIQQFIGNFLLQTLKPLALLVGTVMVVGVASNFAQVGFMLSGEPLSPKLEKIDPLQGFKRLFSSRSAVESLKVIFKSLVFGGLAYDVIKKHQDELVTLGWMNPAGAASAVGQLLHTILIRIAVAWLVLAALDYFYQRKQVSKQLRMTREELKREMKEAETSPELKGAMMQRRRKLLKGRITDTVPKADVVITNPTHFAIAIKYERSKMHAPIVVAKGQDYLASKIREIAKANRVPIVPNPPLARQLYKQCDVGDAIPRELFTAVAEVLAYVYKTLKRVKR